jgi:hypothetical protein
VIALLLIGLPLLASFAALGIACYRQGARDHHAANHDYDPPNIALQEDDV